MNYCMVDYIFIIKVDEKVFGGGVREEVWCIFEG